ncbi:tRNA lysidine(34) synthetase TilS [Mariprofundus ferrinatatus]|uniref:tRNA lysidine(34) synthetase TilS n=1 Tax=Mariprofundus ferrinatatus TaxID=1921087 RepID=UPI001E42EAC5|nr:tRNA lysidine(34) synthetase TilS [Mariprofundus ferrinatatus]
MKFGSAARFAGWLNHAAVPELPHEIAVGWSGGADSTALLLALKEAGHAVSAWHVDHGWRESSRQECEMLAERANSWGIAFYSSRLDAADESNREAVARRGRFDRFLSWSRELGISTLCLAHQLDDQAETVCMRLLQGAGAGGCRGMRRERNYYGLRVVRPLLHVPGIELRTVLREAGVEWFEDPSNEDLSIWRNRIRQRLFPQIAESGIKPDQLFMRWQRQAERLAIQLDKGADAVLNGGSSGMDVRRGREVILPWRQWSDCLPAVRARVLQRMMSSLLGEGVTPGRRHIVMVEQWTLRDGRGGLDLSGCRLQRRQGGLHLLPATSVCAGNLR